jgi:hypothetical protein
VIVNRNLIINLYSYMCETPNPEAERQAKIEAKVAGIKNNPGEERSDGEIRLQAEREVDEGVEVNPE